MKNFFRQMFADYNNLIINELELMIVRGLVFIEYFKYSRKIITLQIGSDHFFYVFIFKTLETIRKSRHLFENIILALKLNY